jgi:hypothetical protein
VNQPRHGFGDPDRVLLVTVTIADDEGDDDDGATDTLHTVVRLLTRVLMVTLLLYWVPGVRCVHFKFSNE